MLNYGRYGGRLLLAGLLLPLMASCFGAGPPEGAESDGRVGEESLRSSDLTFPLDEFDISEPQAEVLMRAQAVLLDECMNRFGIDYTHPLTSEGAGRDGDVENGAGEESRDDRRYGLSDLAHAEEYGYARVDRNSPDLAADTAEIAEELGPYGALALLGAEDENPDALPENQQDAEARVAADPQPVTVDGVAVPPGGCLRESALTLYAPTAETIDVQWVRTLAADAHVWAQQEREVEEAAADWSDCMGTHGYTVTDPLTAAADLGFTQEGSAELDGAEARAAAVQDVTCKQQTALVGTWAEAETALQQRLVEEHSHKLAEFKKQRHQRMLLAEDLLDGSHG